MVKTVTVEEYVAERAGAALAEVFGAIAEAARRIERKVRLANLTDVYGAVGSVNVQGEQQQKLDVFANDLLTKKLGAMPHVAAVVSEEDEGPVLFAHSVSDAEAQFVVIFDPLDGSSNIDVNVNVGTIFSVVRMVEGDAVRSATGWGRNRWRRGMCCMGLRRCLCWLLEEKPPAPGMEWLRSRWMRMTGL